MSKTTFSGPLRTGKNTGVPVTTTLGHLVAEQRVTVAVASKKARLFLPPNSSLIEGTIFVTDAVSGIAAGVNVRLGTSADEGKFSVTPVSARNLYRIAAVSAPSVLNFGTSVANTIAVDATAQASAADLVAFQAVVSILYRQGE